MSGQEIAAKQRGSRTPGGVFFKAAGTTREDREELMALVMEVQTQSIILKRMGTEMGSAGDELRLLAFTNLVISSFGNVWKYTSSGGDCISNGTDQGS